MLKSFVMIFGCAFIISACVPKTQFDDQEARLKEVQEKLKEAEDSSNTCDRNTVMQLREQTQSLDLLQQELIERNTELSKEVARLRVFESQSKHEQLSCDQKLADLKEADEGRTQRIRATYEDLIKELKAENEKLKEALKEAKEPKPSKPPSHPKSKK